MKIIKSFITLLLLTCFSLNSYASEEIETLRLKAKQYFLGENVTQNYAEVVPVYSIGSELSDDDIMVIRAAAYSEGLIAEKDPQQAIYWLLKALELNINNSDAMNDIGVIYQGIDFKQDYLQAMQWFLQAAKLNNAQAMNNIVIMYEQGLGVEKDPQKAQEWRAKAQATSN